MTEMYTLVRTVHVTSVALSLTLFLVRLGWAWSAPVRLQHRWVRVLPHVIDTVLLASAIGLSVIVHQYPFVQAWLTAKVLALIVYIIAGSFALKRARTGRGRALASLVALASVGYIIAVALTRSPNPIG